jgi:hypothetical protein
MSFVDSQNSVFKLDDSSGTLRTLTQYVNSVDGLPGARNLNEVTAFSDTGTKSIPSIQNGKFSIAGDYDSTATTGPHVVLSGLALTATATASFEYHPEGTTTGKPKLSGECWCSSYVITSKVGSQVSYKADFQIDGVVTVTVN